MYSIIIPKQRWPKMAASHILDDYKPIFTTKDYITFNYLGDWAVFTTLHKAMEELLYSNKFVAIAKYDMKNDKFINISHV